MRKPTYVSVVALSVAFAACTKAEFVPTDGDAGGAPPDGAPPDGAVCEKDPQCLSSSGQSVPCQICHTGTNGTWAQCKQSGNGVDNCGQGNVCLLSVGGSGGYCFELCADSTLCNGVSCSARLWSGKTTLVTVCDPDYVICAPSSPCCDPLPLDTSNDLCSPDRTCYLIPPQPADPSSSWTVCDYASGGLGVGQTCTSWRDCVPGLTCYIPPGSTSSTGTCREVCTVGDTTACKNRGCSPYGQKYGVCPLN